MALDVQRVDVWAAGMEDRPGGLAEKLAVLAEAGAQLEFLIARRAPDKPGTGVVFVTPLKGAKQIAAARKAGFKKSKSLRSIRISGADKPGLGAKITQALAAQGINLRGLSAAVIGRRFVAHIAVDTPAALTKTVRVLKGLK